MRAAADEGSGQRAAGSGQRAAGSAGSGQIGGGALLAAPAVTQWEARCGMWDVRGGLLIYIYGAP
jgi:hypothetical protein